jgi:hypothetical protein
MPYIMLALKLNLDHKVRVLRVIPEAYALRIQLRIQDYDPGVDAEYDRHANWSACFIGIPNSLDIFVVLFKVYVMKIVAHNDK